MLHTVIRAEEWRSSSAHFPELQLILKSPDQGPLKSNLMDSLCETGIWHRVETDTTDWLIYASDGDFHTSRLIRPDQKGKYKVRGSDGKEWPYSWFAWRNLSRLEGLGELVQVSCRLDGSGNIQTGLFARTIVEAKAKEAGLEFAVQHGQITYTGPKDRFRSATIYPNSNGVTWGVHFQARAYESAYRQEDWGGACWPDKETVQVIADNWIKNGIQDVCANLTTLKARFPKHPSVPKLERYLNQK